MTQAIDRAGAAAANVSQSSIIDIATSDTDRSYARPIGNLPAGLEKVSEGHA